MFLKKIELTNFRNFKKQSFDFSKLNIISGPNGRGKTNILEAIYLLSCTKSFRTAKNSDLVLWGKDFARIVADTTDKGKKFKIEFILDLRPERLQPKTIKIDGQKRKLFFALGKLKTVLFSPESLDIILGSPQQRRRFLDFLISQQDSKYAKYLMYLARILKNRNAVLFRISQREAGVEELDFWTKELTDYGSLIILRRGQLINYFNGIVSKRYQEISGKSQELTIDYKNKSFQPDDISKIKEKFLKKLERARDREILLQRTLVGPQRDNLTFKIDDKNMESFGSRGEVRSAILALKLTEVEFLSQKSSGDLPVFLLDDVFSELDEERREYLAKMLSKTQTIITACDLKNISPILRKKAKIFKL